MALHFALLTANFPLLIAPAVALLLYWLMGERRTDTSGTDHAQAGAGLEPAPVLHGTPDTPHSALPAPHSRGFRLRRIGFALLGGLAVFLLLGSRDPVEAPRSRPRGDLGRAYRSYTQGLLEAKRSFDPQMLQKGETAEGVRARAIRAYQEAVRHAPDSVLFRRQLGILQAFHGDLSAARAQFRRVERSQRSRGDPRAGSEARLWARAYDSPPPAAGEIPEIRRELSALRLGWFEHLVLATLHRRAGQAAQAEERSRTAGREARAQMGLLGAAAFLLFLLALAGFLGGPVFLIRALRGKIRPVPARFHVGPVVLWEAFILYIFLYSLDALPRLISPGLPAGPSERGIPTTILLILGSDALQFLAVLYLALALRRERSSLAEVGLHARAFAANVAFGLAAYVVVLPWVIAAGWLTDLLGRRLFPDVSPPFHPIQALTAGSQDWWLRAALLVIAAVGAPFFEELFFRGALHGALRRRFGVAVGVLASAALFAALHPQLPLGFLPIFFLGAVFAVIYEWRQSLVPGMLFHAVHNGFLVVLINLLFPPAG